MAEQHVPRFAVLTPIHGADQACLAACLASVGDQSFDDWEHVLVDDGSTDPATSELVATAAAADPRVRWIHQPVGAGEAGANRAALAAAVGELIVMLDHRELLHVDALAEMNAAFADPGVDVAYSDHDVVDADGFVIESAFKPDFAPEWLRAHDYVTPLVAARRTLADSVGAFDDRYTGALDHDFALRLTERARRVAHVRRALCHVRTPVPESPPTAPAAEGGVRAVADHCARVGIDVGVEATINEGCYRLVRRVADRPLVSVVIPTRGATGRVWGATRCYVVEAVRSLAEHSTYRQLEFVVVYDADTPEPVLSALGRVPNAVINLVPYRAPFNFSAKINLGVAHASGDLVLLLNDDTELIEPASVEVLVGHLQTPGVAAAGAKLLFADGTLQHGGVVNSIEPDHACLGWRGDSAGPRPLRPLAVERECSAVTAACALVDRAAFDEVGGFATELPLNYNDVDFCLKLRAAGHRIVWSPWAVLFHFESRTRLSRVLPEELAWLDDRWHAELTADPYYNPNLVPGRHDFLEMPTPFGLPRRAVW